MSIKKFLDQTPDAVAYARDMKKAITEKRIPLTGSPFQVAQRAYAWARRGWENSIDAFFEEEDKAAADKFNRKGK